MEKERSKSEVTVEIIIITKGKMEEGEEKRK
jgi:hypothetical protein